MVRVMAMLLFRKELVEENVEAAHKITQLPLTPAMISNDYNQQSNIKPQGLGWQLELFHCSKKSTYARMHVNVWR